MKYTTTTRVLSELPADGVHDIDIVSPMAPGDWRMLGASIVVTPSMRFIIVWSWVIIDDDLRLPPDGMLPTLGGLRFICPECRTSDWRLGEGDRRHCSNGRCGLSWTPESDWKYFFEARPFADREEFEMHQKFVKGMGPKP